MRNASRMPTGDDTVRNTNAHAVPLAALTITRASTITDKNRCCWTHCQTITSESYPGRAKPTGPGSDLVRPGRAGSGPGQGLQNGQAGSGTQFPWKPAG